MEESHLYQQIAESIRREIFQGVLKPGERLPSVRQTTRQWNCTPGTVQRAYRELARQGLINSRAGQGTHVVGLIAESAPDHETPMRRASLVHRAESFLLEALTSGYAPDEIERAVRQALDRWRAVEDQPAPPQRNTLRFHGSHDLAISWMASHLDEILPAGEAYRLEVQFTGSLGGLIALAEGKADLAGCHLWDEESDTYNVPFLRRLMPGRKTALVALGQRRLGLILPPGNPLRVQGLADLRRKEIRFANRQRGSGTRVWLDAHLRQAHIDSDQIQGYDREMMTHSDVAQAIATGESNAGLGLEISARAFGLDFLFLTQERYDLAIPDASFQRAPFPALVQWLASPAAKPILCDLGGYDPAVAGEIRWVE